MNSKTITLGDICYIEKGKIGIQAAIPGDYPLVTTAAERGSHNEYHFKGEAVCIPLVSATGHGHASIKRIHFQKGKFCVGNILCACIPKDYNKTSAKFLHLYFSLFKDVILVPLMQGSTNVSLKIKDLEKVEVPDVSFERQLDIVDEFERLEVVNKRLLTELDHQQTYLQLLRQTILQKAMEGRLTKRNKGESTFKEQELEDLRKSYQATEANKRGVKSFTYKKADKIDLGGRTKGVDELFIIPDSWRWVSLAQVTWSISDGPHFSPNYVHEGFPMVSSRNISLENGLDFSSAKFVSPSDYAEFIKRGKPEVGDVLYTKGGTTGVPALVEVNRDFCVWVHVALLKLIKEVIDPYYLRLVLASSFVYNQSQKQTHGIGNKDLGLTRMSFMAFPLPPLAEQQRIVAKVQQLQQQLSQLEAQVQQSRQYAQQLLQSVLEEAFEHKGKVYKMKEEQVSMVAED